MFKGKKSKLGKNNCTIIALLEKKLEIDEGMHAHVGNEESKIDCFGGTGMSAGFQLNWWWSSLSRLGGGDTNVRCNRFFSF